MSDVKQAIFGVHADALVLRQQRLDLIASNIANTDTPGFKAQDIDFAAALRAASGRAALPDEQAAAINKTLDVRRDVELAGRDARFFRPALQPSLDGNTVDSQLEHAAFAKAALEYRTSLGFIESKVRGLLLAITGQ